MDRGPALIASRSKAALMSMQDSDFADHFGIDNIPFGIASSRAHPLPQAVTRFENHVLFLAELAELQEYSQVLIQPTLNEFAALGRSTHANVRVIVQQVIRSGNIATQAQEDVSKVQMHLPVAVGDYTDFSCSPTHNRNAPAALMGQSGRFPPGYLHMPLGYAGRCSSIVISGTQIMRPRGHYFEYGIEGLQGKRTHVTYGPVKALDYELEMAVIIGKPVPYGEYIQRADQSSEHVFGYVLVNDWSSRDIQQLEMIPVGPFQSKHSATSISAWIITPDAVGPYTVPAKMVDRPPVAPHLQNHSGHSLSVDVSVSVITQGSKKVIGQSNLLEMDWTFDQIITHQASGGSGLRPGDMLAIGTISGPGEGEQGCLMEEFIPGKVPVRGYIQDDEEVQIIGVCGPGVGFGQCSSKVVPSADQSFWPAAA